MAHPAWPIIENALADLEENKDLELKTAARYVIGNILEQLAANGLIPPGIIFSESAGAEEPRYRWILQIESSSRRTPEKRKLVSKAS